MHRFQPRERSPVIRLHQFLNWLLPVAICFALMEVAVLIFFRELIVGIAVVVTCSYMVCLLIARQQLRRGRVKTAVGIICGGLLGVDLIVVLVWPILVPGLAVLPFLVVAIALPYIDGAALRRLIVTSWLVAVMVALLGEVVPSAIGTPPWVASLLRISTLTAAVALALLLLWQFSNQLSETLAQIQAAQQGLEAQNEWLAVTLHSIADGVITTDERGHVLTLNKAAEALTGWTEAEAASRPLADILQLVDGSNGTSTGDPVGTMLRTGAFASPRSDLTLIGRDGTRHSITGSAGQIRDADGQLSGLVLAFHDVSEQRQAEEERLSWERKILETQKLESLGVLAGGIAHDFNNLLIGVLGNASLALRELPSDSPTRYSIEQIELAARRASDLTRQMLAYSGKGRFLVQPLNLNHLITEMTSLLSASITKTATLQFDLAADLPFVEGDATQIRQVVMNLIVNAAEAIGSQPGTISVRTGVQQVNQPALAGAYLATDLPPGMYVELEVADTGCGMDAETQKKIFEPFYTTKFTGRGLGLSAVIGIVRGHRGTLKVRSAVGRGTTFTILLPRAEHSVWIVPSPAPTVIRWNGSGTVLVIDDDESVRTVAAQMLRHSGYQVLTAADGQEGVELFEQHADAVVCVLLDLMMPNMAGEETFHAIRRLRSDAQVVLMSGYTEQEATTQFASAGLAGFLQKPFTVDDIGLMMWQVREKQKAEG